MEKILRQVGHSFAWRSATYRERSGIVCVQTVARHESRQRVSDADRGHLWPPATGGGTYSVVAGIYCMRVEVSLLRRARIYKKEKK